MGILLVAPFLAVTPMVAAETANSSSPTTNSTTTTTTTKTTDTTTKTDDVSETFEDSFKKLSDTESKKQTQADRLKARVTDLKTKLSAADQAKLKLKCVAAQVKVKELETNVNNGVTARGKAYDELLSHLDKAITKLKAAKVDTTELEKERTELKVKIDTFKTDLVKYKIALGDTKDLGCVADPSAFKASLEAARTSRTAVATDAAAIRTYVNDTIKPTLKTIKATVDKDPAASSAKPTTTTTTTTSTGGAQ